MITTATLFIVRVLLTVAMLTTLEMQPSTGRYWGFLVLLTVFALVCQGSGYWDRKQEE